MSDDEKIELDLSAWDGYVPSDVIEADRVLRYEEQEALARDREERERDADELRRHRPSSTETQVPGRSFGAVEVLDEHGRWVDPAHLVRVADAVEQMRVRDDARREYQAEIAPPEPFDFGTLAEVLARSPEPEARVEGFLPWEAGLLLIATRKTGKTTLSLGLARSLITGDDFLGAMKVRPIKPEARVGYMNFEVSAATFAKWASEAGIPTDRLVVVNLRGKRNPFSNDADLARLAGLLRQSRVETLIVDVFGRAFTGTDQNSNSEVQAWFGLLDQWARESVGALDVIVTAHAGKEGSSFRGASTAEGWTDVNAYLTREGTAPGAVRHLRAEGRDVSIDDTALAFDPATRQFTIDATGGSAGKTNEAFGRIVRLLNDAGAPMSGRAIERAMEGIVERDDVRRALSSGETTGRLGWQVGKNRAHDWFVIDLPDAAMNGGGDDDD